MPGYKTNFITQMLIRADFVRGSFPLTAAPGEEFAAALADYPLRTAASRSKNEIRIQKTPQGPVKDTLTIPYTEYGFQTEDKTRRVAVSSEFCFLECRAYEGFEPLKGGFLELMDAAAAVFPGVKLNRFGMRYINEIRLPDVSAGPGLGAEFWKRYVNELLLGGLRFAANDGALARQMNSIELNYGLDRATVKYGVFNTEYPKPNRRREFILDIDTYCQTELTPAGVPAKLDAFHTAACSVFETAITDALRERMGR